jgi:hypothetical protein
MELLLFFLALAVAASVVIWWSTRATTYRVKNRDVPPKHTSSGREPRSGLDISKMLD